MDSVHGAKLRLFPDTAKLFRRIDHLGKRKSLPGAPCGPQAGKVFVLYFFTFQQQKYLNAKRKTMFFVRFFKKNS